MHAFILAGGFATRLWPLTEQRAKPLLPLAGKPLLTHLLERIPSTLPITVSTNAVFGTQMEQWGNTMDRPVAIRIEATKKDDEKLGALGALAQWIREEQIREDILLLTGDNYIGFNLNTFIDQYIPGTPLLAAYDIADPLRARSFGTVIVDEDGRTIRAFEEKPATPKSTLVSTGCSILPAGMHDLLLAYAQRKPDNVGGIFEELLALGHSVDCFTFSGLWFDIGSFEDYLSATRALVGNRVEYGSDVTCISSTCEGSVVLGNGTRLQSSTLRDTVLFDRCTIEDCILEECIIDDDCVLKGIDLRGKMIRRGTHLTRGES